MQRAEIANLIAEQGEADVACEFCKKSYHLSRNELEWLNRVM
ncbi:MAG: Hsp33 family molecular chaperone HslO [Pseudomonadota bacterium]